MNFLDWYTDTIDIYRVVDSKDGNLTRKERTLLSFDVPCRVYREKSSSINLPQTAGSERSTFMVSCDNAVDIRAGDEIIVHRGGRLGHNVTYRAFAGEPNHYFEPFGAVIPGLAHQEVQLLSEERI